jgi:hypothetical protein
LAWRLALLHRNPKAGHEKILATWYTERKQQLDRSLAATVRNGKYVTESDPFKVFVREWYMWAIQLVPSYRKEIELGARAAGMTKYQHKDGLPFIPEMDGGLLLPQVYAYNFKTRKISFTDDLIFAPKKVGLFQLLILPDSIEDVDKLIKDVGDVDRISNNLIQSGQATILIQSTQASTEAAPLPKQDIARLATGEEFAADPVLCNNRPEPIGYDERRLQRGVKGKKYVILRQDRFVFAACNTTAELRQAASQLGSMLSLAC